MRTALFGALLSLVLGGVAEAQHYGHPYGNSRAMSPTEASAIAEYWIHSYFRRYPDRREVRYWAERLIQQQPTQVLVALLASDEYYDYSGSTPRGYARQLIADVGHHEASRYELEDLLAASGGANRQQLAYSMLRRYPGDWWPGPTARPPKELLHLYSNNYGRESYYGWR